MQRVYSLIVDNTTGVLSRISGLFSRRGYSIDSITAGVTADPRFTRITIVRGRADLISDREAGQEAGGCDTDQGVKAGGIGLP